MTFCRRLQFCRILEIDKSLISVCTYLTKNVMHIWFKYRIIFINFGLTSDGPTKELKEYANTSGLSISGFRLNVLCRNRNVFDILVQEFVIMVNLISG